MRDGNFEQFIILALVLLAWVVNFVLDWLRNRGRTAQPQDREEDLAVEEEEIDLAEAMGRERAAEAARGPAPARVPVTLPAPETRSADPRPQVVVPATLPDSRGTSPEASPRLAPAQRVMPSVRPRVPQPRSPVGSPESRRLRRRIDRSEARRGVVLMTILGPCRGVEPPAGNASGRHLRRERAE